MLVLVLIVLGFMSYVAAQDQMETEVSCIFEHTVLHAQRKREKVQGDVYEYERRRHVKVCLSPLISDELARVSHYE